MNRIILFSGTHGAGFGAERVLDHLLDAASAAVGLVIAPPGSGAEATAQELGIETLPWNSPDNSTSGNLLAFRRFDWKKARSHSCDLLHAWHTRGFEWGLVLGKRLRVPVCGTLHDNPTSSRNSRVRKFLLRTSANRMQALAIVSDALHRICTQERWTVPMTVIRNGLPDTPTTEARKNCPELRIGFVGLNERWKGIDTVSTLVEAFQALPVVWEFFGSPSVGTQPLIDDLLARFPTKVHFHGRRTPAEIYSDVDVILHPSIEFDPYPTVLLEAARAGIPVIASAIGGAPEIVKDGKTGRLYPPGDVRAAHKAITALLSDSNERLLLGQAAREHYQARFRVEMMAKAYKVFWEGLLHASPLPIPQ